MDISSIVSREEFEKTTKLTYDQFCDFASRIIKKSVEESLRALPAVMTHIGSQVAYLKGLSDNFYDANKDLNAHRPIVAQVMETIEAENPGLSYEQVIKQAGPIARSRVLTLQKAGQGTGEVGPRKLSLVDERLKGI